MPKEIETGELAKLKVTQHGAVELDFKAQDTGQDAGQNTSRLLERQHTRSPSVGFFPYNIPALMTSSIIRDL